MRLFNLMVGAGLLMVCYAQATTIKCNEADHALNLQFSLNPAPALVNLSGSMLTSGGLVNYDVASVVVDETKTSDEYSFPAIKGRFANGSNRTAQDFKLNLPKDAFNQGKTSVFAASGSLSSAGGSIPIALRCKTID